MHTYFASIKFELNRGRSPPIQLETATQYRAQRTPSIFSLLYGTKGARPPDVARSPLMKFISVAALALALACGPLGAAQLYRWVDEKGNVEYRDTPPPANAKKVERRDMTGNTIETSALPYSVQQAVKNHPVTLWSFDCGDPCTKARVHLAKRGVPHTERSPQKEPDAMKKVTGGLDVPVLIVGKNQLKGYLDETWDSALDAAGYPRTAPPGMKPQVQPTAKGSTESASKAAASVPKPAAETEKKAAVK